MENRIAELRKEKGLTLKQLGEILGIRDNTLSQYETGKRNPHFGLLQEIADLFHVSIEYLTKGTDKRDFPVSNDKEMLDILDMIDNDKISLFNLSKITMLELAIRITQEWEEFSNGKYQHYQKIALFTLDTIKGEVETLDLYSKIRKSDNEIIEKIYDKLVFDETAVSPQTVLTFMEEAERISYDDLEAILDKIKSLPDDTEVD